MWASGDYPRSSSRRCSCRLGPELVRARGLGSGRRVLDGAAGTGNAALHAAEVAASERTAAVARGWQRAKATSPSNSRFAAIAGAPSNGWGNFTLMTLMRDTSSPSAATPPGTCSPAPTGATPRTG
jgi:hypothetical protein